MTTISLLTLAWSMCAGACATIGLTQGLLGLREDGRRAYLLSAAMSLAACATALVELAMMKSDDVASYARLIQWENFTVGALLVSLVWFVHLRLGSRRARLAMLITVLWIASLVINVVSSHSIVFSAIDRLDVYATPWGEVYAVAVGEASPWVLVPNIASLLIVAYVADAGLCSWRDGERRRAVLVAGSAVVFMLLGGIHAPLVDIGWLKMPYMISFAYLAIVFAFAYELADSGRQAALLANERAQALSAVREAHQDFDRLARASILGELVTGIAHELNQPLAAILTNAQTAKRMLSAPEPDLAEFRAILEDVIRDDKRAGEVIHHLRAMLEKRPSQREPVRLAALLRETTDLLHADLQASRIQVTLDADDPTWQVEADRVGLQQVLLNLLSNAIRALGQVPEARRRLYISLRRHGEALSLCIADSGPGIAQEVRAHLFDAFHTSRSGSMGMGLALCKRIVEAHGGTIEAVDRGGGGAEFHVTLPTVACDG